MMNAHHRTRLAIAGICALLQACASAPLPAPAPAPESVQDEVAPVILMPADPSGYEAAQRAHAGELERQGRLAEAALVWEVLAIIRPANDEYRARLSELNRRIAGAAAERVQRGDQAAARGQLDVAMSFYLSALALQHDNARAADALRNAEREMNRRNHLGKLTRHTLTRKAMADADMVPPPRTDAVLAPAARSAAVAPPPLAAPEPQPATPTQARGSAIEVEHASLLASQGEYAEAVAMLENWLQSNRRDTAARNMLADVYVQQAESVASSNPKAAIELLEKTLQLDRSHRRATERLRQLKAGSAR